MDDTAGTTTAIDEGNLDPSAGRALIDKAAEPLESPASVNTVERVFVRDPLTGGHAFGPDGAPMWPPQPDLADLEPLGSQEVLEVDPDAWFGTNEGRLLAEGWQPPTPDVHEVLLQREALRLAVHRAGGRAGQDPGAILAAISRADVDGIERAITANALDAYLTVIEASPYGGDVVTYSHNLETRWHQLAYQRQRSILRSLVGRESAAAERLRRAVLSMAQLGRAPEAVWPSYAVRR